MKLSRSVRESVFQSVPAFSHVRLQEVDTTQSTSGERFVIKIHDSGSQGQQKAVHENKNA